MGETKYDGVIEIHLAPLVGKMWLWLSEADADALHWMLCEMSLEVLDALGSQQEKAERIITFTKKHCTQKRMQDAVQRAGLSDVQTKEVFSKLREFMTFLVFL